MAYPRPAALGSSCCSSLHTTTSSWICCSNSCDVHIFLVPDAFWPALHHSRLEKNGLGRVHAADAMPNRRTHHVSSLRIGESLNL